MSKMIDITGQRFGRLVAKGMSSRPSDNGKFWICQCDCGAEVEIRCGSLRAGGNQSCGCLNREKPWQVRHGGAGTRLYGMWLTMRRRCSSPGNAAFENYGARGIKVCAEWEDFAVFREWALSTGYRPGLTIERRDNDAGYAPSNCEWIPQSQQARNTRTVRRSPSGEPWVAIAERNGITANSYRARIKIGWPDEKAATTPINAHLSAVSRKSAALVVAS